MLKKLEISNYALIENVNLDFEKGFTVITGDTGAGKSILLKALNLLLGDRADTSVLRKSEKKCFLEAEFDIKNLTLKPFFDENELDFDDICIVRREFNTSGKSRAFINDTPVQLAQLKALGQALISIHAQHQTLDIFNADYQMDVLDHFAKINDETQAYKRDYQTYRKKVNRLAELQVKDKESRKEKDYLNFLLDELDAANLENTDYEELKAQSNRMENAERIDTAIRFAQSVFENENFGPSVGIKTLLETFEELKGYDPKYADTSARLLSLKIELDDLESEVNSLQNDDHFTSEESEIIREKIELFNALTFKHNMQTKEELIALKDSIQNDLNAISSVENELEKTEAEIAKLKTALLASATKIRTKRLKIIPRFEKQISELLTKVAMPEAELQVQLNELDKFGATGIDAIEFLFKTNLGGDFAPVKKVASGGELSRLMLCVLRVLSDTKKLPTLIFDEIDTGVSGEVAAKMAKEFVAMGEKIQVIAITHLAQVAGKGSKHLHVSKQIKDKKTTTSVQYITEENRINALARMISGEEITSAALENAAQLLAQD